MRKLQESSVGELESLTILERFLFLRRDFSGTCCKVNIYLMCKFLEIEL